MKPATVIIVGTLTVGASGALAGAPEAASHGRARYEVTVTNITHDQRFTPVLVVAHRPGVTLFRVGKPASPELETLAEEGDTAPLAARLEATRGVNGIATSAGILSPGQTVTIQVSGRPHDRVSLAAMLIPTNDAFVALSGVAPFGRIGRTFTAPAYDAGTDEKPLVWAQ